MGAVQFVEREGGSELILLANNKWKGICLGGNFAETRGQWMVNNRINTEHEQ